MLPRQQPRRKDGRESGSMTLPCSPVQRGPALIVCCPDRSPRRKEGRDSGSMAALRRQVQRGEAHIVRCPDRSPRRKEDLESGSMALPRSQVQRGPSRRVHAVHVRPPAQGTGCRAQQASQAGHVARARGGHEASAPLRPVVHEQHRGVKVVVAPQRVVAHAVHHRIRLHIIALTREQWHDTLERRPLGHDAEGGGREHACVRRGGLCTPRPDALQSSCAESCVACVIISNFQWTHEGEHQQTVHCVDLR